MLNADHEPDAEAGTAKLAERAEREAFLAEMSAFVEVLRLGLVYLGAGDGASVLQRRAQ